MCGKDALKKVVLGTTMWDTSRAEICKNHTKDLKNCHWQPLIEAGSMVEQFGYSQASAWEIVDALLKPLTERAVRGELETALQIQKELIDDRKVLLQTEAGKMVLNHLKKLIVKQEYILQRTQPGEAANLEREFDNLQKQLQSLTNDLKQTKVPLGLLPPKVRRFLGL